MSEVVTVPCPHCGGTGQIQVEERPAQESLAACCICGKLLKPPSKPRWAIERVTWRVLGRAHATCVSRLYRTVYGSDVTVTSVRAAQFHAWAWDHRSVGTGESWAYLAWNAIEPSEDLSEQQEALLRWWQERPNSPISAEVAADLRNKYIAMVRQFEAEVPA